MAGCRTCNGDGRIFSGKGTVPRWVLAVWLLAGAGAWAQGIPEPDLVVYGIVKNVRSNANLRVGYGTLHWVYQPAGGGAPVTASTTLTNINEQFSYVLRVPCETPVQGFTSTSNTIQLTGGGITFNRRQVTWQNTNLLSFVIPSQTNTSFGSTDRGRIERVDLDVDLPIVVDVNGLPVDWQLMYFGRTGVDPFGDPDGDGMNTREEFVAGTNPNDGASGLWITDIQPWGGGGGVQVKWTSAVFKTYALQRSSSPDGGFADLVTGLTASAPTNSFVDLSAASGPWFYRIRVEEGGMVFGTPLRLLSLAEDLAGGLRVEWSSEENRIYAVQRSSNVSTGFADIQLNLAATPPVNSYRDSNATGLGPYFYRLRLQQP